MPLASLLLFIDFDPSKTLLNTDDCLILKFRVESKRHTNAGLPLTSQLPTQATIPLLRHPSKGQ